jgi:class 3 adenylate cyclase/tetratricopeptide (TPR) repeat protein
MDFEQILDSAIELLQRRQRLTYSALKRQFQLDDAALEDLKQELIRGQRVARDEDGLVLVWQGAAPVAPAATAAAPGAAESAPRVQAERRQLTIMFCDLANSTALSNSLDIEELRAVLRAFQDAAGEVIARHQGFVNSYLGDGIVTFFGYPKAQEDDARRAVRAGLEVAAAVAALRGLPGGALQVRVGIATGVVVVGDVIGKGASREEAVVGSASNLAARLQALARPNEVVISASTKRLLGAAFECQDMGPQQLKGFEQPMPTWRVTAERSEASLLDGAPRWTPMIDREVELPALVAAWRAASAGQGRVVTLRGEAGLGKSRLCAALLDQVLPTQPVMLNFLCSQRYQNTALYPVIRYFEQAAGFADEDQAGVRLDKLQALLLENQGAAEVESVLPYFAALLSVPPSGRFAPISDSPERQREQTLKALLAQISMLARERPVMILFEDLHWVDPTTMSLLDQLVHQIAKQPVMVLATSRPEFDPPWADLPQALTVELSLLGLHHRACIVEQQTAGKALPPEILEHVLQKSDGIPLYVEELTKAMIESGLLLEEADRFVLTGSLRGVAIPSTLHDSLLARLDRLAVAKDVVQAGAAIGRDFAYTTLAAVLPLPVAELNNSLARLVESGLIHGQGLPPDAVYTFKHALIQDAAYATMLRPKRQGLHAQIAQVLEADPVPARRAPELLAHHFSEADQGHRAAPYLLQAGLKAAAGAAHTEACKYFDEGLRLTQTLPEDAARNRLEMGLRLHLGMSLAATRGFAAPEVESTHQRARDLCRLLDDKDELFWVLRALCALYTVRGRANTAQELSDDCVRLGQETRRPEFMVEALVMEGYTQGLGGNLTRGRGAMDRVVQIYRSTEAGRFAYPTPQDPSVASLTFAASLSLAQGDLDLGVLQIEDALRTAQALKRPFDLTFAQAYAAMFENLRRNYEQAAHHAGIAIEIAQRHGFAGWLAASAMQLGVAKAGLGAAQEAIGLIGSTLPAWQASGAALNNCFFMAGLAAAYRGAGQLEQALQTATQAIEHAERHSEHWYDAELYRLRGELLLQMGAELQEAEDDFERALAVARQQGALTFELRAAISLARGLLAAGDKIRAPALLRAAIAQHGAARGSQDHREAAELLDTLAA